MSTQLKLTNNAVGRLSANISAQAGTIQLVAGQGAKFPSTADGFPFMVTITNSGGAHEIVRVLDRTFDVFTVARAQEGTAALAFVANDIVELRLTAGALLTELTRLDAKINAAVTAFTPSDPQPMTTAAIKTALAGAITENELLDTLRSRISLIDDPAGVPGSVAARVKAESDARAAAFDAETQARVNDIQAEIDARLQGDQAEAAARTTYVQNYTYARSTIDSALSIQAQLITANYTAYADAARASAISVAAADVRDYSYSKANIDSAEATRLTAITTAYTGYADAKKAEALAEAAADVRTYAYSKTSSDAALASLTSSLTTSYTGYADAKKVEAITAAVATAAADVREYSYSKSAIDSAEASQNSTITANYTAYANSTRDSAITTAAADVRNYSYSKASTDSALSALESTLRSEFVASGGATEGYVQNYAYSKANIDAAEASQSSSLTTAYQNYADARKTEAITAASADVRNFTYAKSTIDSAIATSTSTLSTTVGDHTTAIQTNLNSINGLKGQYTVKIDNNGYVSGFGLASTATNGAPSSSFVLLSDVFKMVAPGTPAGNAGVQMLDIEVVGGVPTATFAGKLVAATGTFTGDLSASQMTTGILNVERIANGALVNRYYKTGYNTSIPFETVVNLGELTVTSPTASGSTNWSGEITYAVQVESNGDGGTGLTMTAELWGYDTLTSQYKLLDTAKHTIVAYGKRKFAILNGVVNWGPTIESNSGGQSWSIITVDPINITSLKLLFSWDNADRHEGNVYWYGDTVNVRSSKISATTYKK